jgi:FlaA1/EpsC-like NDP-sugar epimerase
MHSLTDRLISSFPRVSGVLRLVLDVLAWTVAAWLAVFLRFDFAIPDEYSGNLVIVIPVVAVLQWTIGFSIGLYRRRWRYGSFDEVAALVATSVATTVTLASLNYWLFTPRLLPMSSIWFAGVIGLVLMAASRYSWRLMLERNRRPKDAARTLIFGAGDGGEQAIQVMLNTPTSPYLPVAILDDDPLKKRLSIRGVRVLGDRSDLSEVARSHEVEVFLIAIPSIEKTLLRQLTNDAEALGLKVKILPPVTELVSDHVELSDIRDLTESDLLGRHEVVLDLSQISDYLKGQRVLVTGAGGSIGSELCRQLAQFELEELMMLDRDESALHDVQLSIYGHAMLDTPDVILCDIRDFDGLRTILSERRPTIIFHAAALKHLPMLEQYPAEAYKTNVLGTLNLCILASEIGVSSFVNISTDKAANPTCILGYSKRVAERLTAAFSEKVPDTFVSVRFGNVLNSRGSVLTTFREQIERGGPVTVTHPEVSRYFMTIPEAVRLVLQAGAIGRSGEVMVLDMGAPVNILEVAKRMIAQSGRDIDIAFTNLRSGEKIHEERFGRGELDTRPFHKLISHADVPPLDLEHIPSGAPDGRDEVQRLLISLVTQDLPG